MPVDWRVRPPFHSFPVLRGSRVTLRQVRVSDAGDVKGFTMYDGVLAETDVEAAAVLQRIDEDYGRGEAVHWGICAAGSPGRVVGTCGYYRGLIGDVGEIGYVLGEDSRGQGFMTESVRLVVDFGFDVMKLAKVVAFTNAENLSSVAVLRRCGFEEDANIDDLLTFSISLEMWFAAKG